MTSYCVCPSHFRASPRLLCTATQQKNGHRSEEEAEKPEQSSAEKVLMEEKTQLEDQLKDMTVSQDKVTSCLAEVDWENYSISFDCIILTLKRQQAEELFVKWQPHQPISDFEHRLWGHTFRSFNRHSNSLVCHPELHCILSVTFCFLSHDLLFPPSFQEKYKRALADTENLRTRSQKMIEDAKLYGNDPSPTFTTGSAR